MLFPSLSWLYWNKKPDSNSRRSIDLSVRSVKQQWQVRGGSRGVGVAERLANPLFSCTCLAKEDSKNQLHSILTYVIWALPTHFVPDFSAQLQTIMLSYIYTSLRLNRGWWQSLIDKCSANWISACVHFFCTKFCKQNRHKNTIHSKWLPP